MYGALDISTSGLLAQKARLNVISANIAGHNTILNADGAYEPYRRRMAILAAGDPDTGVGAGVHVQEIMVDESSPLRMKYEPDSPFADEAGYVGYPNINTVIEQMNAMEAARSYEANISAVEATKSMISAALQMLV